MTTSYDHLSLLSMTHLEKLVQILQENNQIENNKDHLNPSLLPQTNSTTISSVPTAIWMWNPNKQQPQNEADDSWEVRAFAEDSGNNITWPPRSYSCTFCRREFRSAQALGGHMNVHRRDRARLHGTQLQPNSSSTSSFIIPAAHEFVANTTGTSTGGLCFVYQLPNPSSRVGFNPSITTNLNSCVTSTTDQSSSPSTLLSISRFPPTNLISASNCVPVLNFPVGPTLPEIDAFRINNIQDEEATTSSDDDGNEDIDLELRLGHGPIAPT